LAVFSEFLFKFICFAFFLLQSSDAPVYDGWLTILPTPDPTKVYAAAYRTGRTCWMMQLDVSQKYKIIGQPLIMTDRTAFQLGYLSDAMYDPSTSWIFAVMNQVRFLVGLIFGWDCKHIFCAMRTVKDRWH
jgi:hypothetical protein